MPACSSSRHIDTVYAICKMPGDRRDVCVKWRFIDLCTYCKPDAGGTVHSIEGTIMTLQPQRTEPCGHVNCFKNRGCRGMRTRTAT